MDVLTGGLNQGNLLVTSVLLIGLVLVSGRAKMLDKPGIIAAAALGFFTVFIPNELTPFAILYAIIGFGFSVSYLVNLIRK